jgi:V/A-type H+-transporting ATPase subunit I
MGYLLFRKKQKPLMSDIGYILITVSLWSIFWGFAYGEFFGDLGLRLFNLHPFWLERSHAVMPVLVFTVSLGLGHVVIGLLLGFFEGLRKKERHIWLEKAGNLILISGLVTALVVFRGWLPGELFSLSLSLLFIGLIFLVIGGGIGGLVESFGTIGNILSYVRIAAIGLSSAILAVVASKFIDVFGLSILGIFMALSIHLLNFVLAIGGSSLHSARLHYVEFMGRFYDGGGKQYKPFSRRRGTDWKKH